MRAIIRIVIRDISDEKAVELKKACEKLVEKIPDTEVELTIVSRRE